MTSVYDHIPDFGLLYDSVPLYQERKDVDFYVAEAIAAKGNGVFDTLKSVAKQVLTELRKS